MGAEQPAAGFDPAALLPTLSTRPGVYRMLGTGGEVLYVGKARNLKRRVSSYFRGRASSARLARLVADVRSVEVTVTHSEGEALLLENNLIKALQPRYNILLRDDKSYPFIHLSEHEFPRLSFHRGPQRAAGRYFGPFPSAGSVRATLDEMQKLFRVRQCEDSFFNNRSRPCLQYQIGRCSAPCTGLIEAPDYAEDVAQVELFLQGRSNQVVERSVALMEAAAGRLEYELAASLRDRISRLRRIQERQHVSGGSGDLDVVACAVEGGLACVQVLFFRAGRNLGGKAFFPRLPGETSPERVLSGFLPQHYLQREPPRQILLSHRLRDMALLGQTFSDRCGRRVELRQARRGEGVRLMDLARTNAQQALGARLASRSGFRQRFEALQSALDLAEAPEHIECYDISHTMGEATVGSCVVFGPEGPLKHAYRRFNVRHVTPGDDYAAMRQVLERRFRRLRQEEGMLPDLILVDGGPGQVAAAAEILRELQVTGPLLLGVSKGPDRRAGQERLHPPAPAPELRLPADSAALHLIQQIRDEAHRFAIGGHRQRRESSRRTSVLERIPGVGPKRRKRLLQQFGGLRELAAVGVEDLARVEGISPALAQRIYDALHSEG